MIKSSPAQGAKNASVEFTFRELTPAWQVGRRSDQLARALVDPVYLRLRSGRAVAAGIPVCLDVEKQIQTNEITHEALTSRRIAVRIRSPLSPAGTQTAFRVIIRHTPSISNVETAILESFLAKENSVSDGRVSSRELYQSELQDEESRRFLAVFVNN